MRSWLVLLPLLVVVETTVVDSPLCSAMDTLSSRVATVDRNFDPSLVPRDVAFEVSYDARSKDAWLETLRAFARLRQEVSSYQLREEVVGTMTEPPSRRHVAELSLAEERLAEVSREVELLRALAGTLRDHVTKMEAIGARRGELARRLADVGRKLQLQRRRHG